MTFTEDDIINPLTTENAAWNQIQQALLQIHPTTKSFFVLTNPGTGSYIQCAGSAERLTVEMRRYDAYSFKHFIIGKGGNKSPLNVTWATIESKAGAIQVHDAEVLNVTDAETLFYSFYTTGDVPEVYTKRNVTKLHVQ